MVHTHIALQNLRTSVLRVINKRDRKEKQRKNNHYFFPWCSRSHSNALLLKRRLSNNQERKQIYKDYIWRWIFDFYGRCFASFECLDRFLKRLFESSHAFKRTFKNPVNTFLHFLLNKFCAVGRLQAPSLQLLLLCNTLDSCRDDPVPPLSW